mgnify:CR=1 FL=1
MSQPGASKSCKVPWLAQDQAKSMIIDVIQGIII